MIPHPLTLLFCWLLGRGLSNALGYVLQFAGELFDDAARYGWIGDRSLAAALLALGIAATFAGGAFTGAATRLLAERSWPKAAGWAFLLSFLAAALGSSAPLRLYPAVGFALLTSPRFLAPAAGGACLGAYLCGRFHEEPWLQSAEAFMRSWMFWERGGSL
ncbi:MAG: hypothetical protein ACHQ49_15530 [Elusimicrobiota bacterium]